MPHMQENPETAEPEAKGETGAGQPEPEKSKTSRRSLYAAIAAALVLGALFVPLAWQETRAAVISPGDHGRDMYLYDQVAHGKKYLRDFKYVYGPLALEVYGLAFRIGGSSIRTALITRAVLLCMLVALAFWAYRRYASAGSAAVAAFLTGVAHLPFWHTFNHLVATIGIVLFIGAVAPWLKKKPGSENTGRTWRKNLLTVILPTFGVFIVFTCKYNVGMALLAGVAVYFAVEKCVKRSRAKRRNETPEPLMPRRRTWLLFAISLGAILILFSYYFATATSDNIRHSFMFLSKKGQSFGNPFENFGKFLLHPFSTYSPFDGTFYVFFKEVYILAGGIIAFARLALAVKLGKREVPAPRRQAAFTVLLLLFLVHEWPVNGNLYPIAYFGAAPAALLIAMALDHSVSIGRWKARAGYRNALSFGYLPLVAVGFALIINTVYVIQQRTNYPETRLTMQRGKGFVLLPPTQPKPLVRRMPDGSTIVLPPVRLNVINPAKAWNEINRFIEENVPAGEPVLTLPYMPVHNFLSRRPFPMGYLDFLEISGIDERREREVIGIMKKAPVRLVMIENRGFFSNENGVGRIHETCPNLFDFIRENYEPVGTLGDFLAAPGWAGNHGVVIFWRKTGDAENQERIRKFRRELTQLPEEVHSLLRND